MKFADAHCDTLFTFLDNPFNTEKAAWNINKFKSVNGILQYTDICVLPPNHGDSALRIAISAIGNIYKHLNDDINILFTKNDFKPDKINIILALEGASPIIDDINNLYAFHKLGIRAITLTWNHRNFIADGIGVGSNYGLTDFGKLFIKEMQKLNMIIDVSHLNEAGFKDVCEIIDAPFTATHSNAYTIYNHPRNLKDYQIKEIFQRNGFIGLNFYSDFIDSNTNLQIVKSKFYNHLEHFLKLGGENNIGFGADFDGMDKSPFKDVLSYLEIIDYLASEMKLSIDTIEKIAYKNLLDFTLRII